MDEFWDADTETAPRAVDVYMTKLRGKLSDCFLDSRVRVLKHVFIGFTDANRQKNMKQSSQADNWIIEGDTDT